DDVDVAGVLEVVADLGADIELVARREERTDTQRNEVRADHERALVRRSVREIDLGEIQRGEREDLRGRLEAHPDRDREQRRLAVIDTDRQLERQWRREE